MKNRITFARVSHKVHYSGMLLRATLKMFFLDGECLWLCIVAFKVPLFDARGVMTASSFRVRTLHFLIHTFLIFWKTYILNTMLFSEFLEEKETSFSIKCALPKYIIGLRHNSGTNSRRTWQRGRSLCVRLPPFTINLKKWHHRNISGRTK